MAKKTPTFLDKLRALVKDAETEVDEEKKTGDADPDDDDDSEGDSKTADALTLLTKTIKAMDRRLAKIEARDEESEEERKAREAKEKEGKTGDDGDLTKPETAQTLNQAEVDLYTGDSAASIPSRAEILSPGIKLPTLDAATSTKDRAAALCKCQRKALGDAYGTEAGKAAISPFLGGAKADFERLPAALVHAAFMGASELMKAQNNGRAHDSAAKTKDFGKARTVADINAANRKYWADRSAH